MDLTLNIIVHELEQFGHVVRTEAENPRFSGFRLYAGPESGGRSVCGDAGGDAMLYVCGSRADVQRAVSQGLSAIYVGKADSQAVGQAVLSVLQAESIAVVLNALLDLALRFAEWQRDMDATRLADGSLQDLLDISSPFLKNNVVIVDPALKLLAYSKDVPCDDPITMELISHGYHTEENIAKFKLHKRFEPWASADGFVVNDTLEICKYVTVVRSFKTRSSFSLIIVMMCNVAEPEDWLLDVYELFADQVKYWAERDYPEDKPSGNATDTFLKDLFSGELHDADVVQERCKLVGIPFKANFCVFYLKSEEGAALGSRLLSDVSHLVAPAKTVLVNGAVAVLCFNCRGGGCARKCVRGSCPLAKRSLSSRLDSLLASYDIACGRSSMFSELSDAHVAFAQAKAAMGLYVADGKRRPRMPGRRWRRIVAFDDCSVEYLAASVSQADRELLDASYAASMVEAIARHDAQANTDNYRFLYAYLMRERRTSEVAETLHMHRNNVKYRIDRIESLFELDTSDPDLRFALLLAFHMREAGQD